MDETEAGLIAFRPLEIVGKGPGKEALDIDPFFFSPEQGQEILLIIVDAILVIHHAPYQFIFKGGAAFGDDDLSQNRLIRR